LLNTILANPQYMVQFLAPLLTNIIIQDRTTPATSIKST
jgi:hypothetical protein